MATIERSTNLASLPRRGGGVWMGLDDGSPEAALADEERRARAIRERERGESRWYDRIDGGLCATSGVERS